MSDSQIKLHYRNVTSEVVGQEHGISKEQFDELSEVLTGVIDEVNKEHEAGKTPYRDLPYNVRYPEQIKAMAKELRDEFENFVVLGIGGSALGNIALQTALNPYMYNIDDSARNGGPRLFVFDNVDPSQLGSFFDWLDSRLDKTVFNVISKSGRTAETASQFLTIRKMLIERLGDGSVKKHIFATTDSKEGTLRSITDAEGYRNLEVPDGVGGRFSVLSPVGLLSGCVCGVDIDGLLEGARRMDDRVSNTDFYTNPAALNAGINWHYYKHGKPISVMMPYAYALKDFADWYRQLWAESLGKENDLAGSKVFTGPTPVKALGTTDQHSQVQLYREGPNDKLFTFLEVKDFGRKVKAGPEPKSAPELSYLSGCDLGKLINNEKTATEYALAKSKRPSMTVLFDRVDESTVGEFIYLFEVTTSFAGKLFGINTYDQPAVELGKEATFALMGREGFDSLAKEIEPFRIPDEEFIV